MYFWDSLISPTIFYMVDTYKQSLSSKTLFITHFNDVKVIQDLLMSIDRYCSNVLDLLFCKELLFSPII